RSAGTIRRVPLAQRARSVAAPARSHEETSMTATPSPVHEMFPYLRVKSAAEAIEFYKQAFGAVERFRLVEPSGRIGHVELELGPAVLMLSDEYPEYGLVAPPADRDAVSCVPVHVHNAARMAGRAVPARATVPSRRRGA